MPFDNPITTLPADAITGQLTADQIASITAGQITGQLTAAQIATVTAGQVVGQFTAAQIASVSAAAISGQLAGTQLAADSIDGKSINGATITGGLVRTAASGTRWELKSGAANQLTGYTGAADELAGGTITVGSDTAGLTTRIAPPRTTNVTVSLAEIGARSARGSNAPSGWIVTGLRTFTFTEANGLTLSGGNVSGAFPYVPGAAGSPQLAWVPSANYTTDANGYFTVPNPLTTAPGVWWAVQTSTVGASPLPLLILPMADTAGLSSVKLRAFRSDTRAAFVGTLSAMVFFAY